MKKIKKQKNKFRSGNIYKFDFMRRLFRRSLGKMGCAFVPVLLFALLLTGCESSTSHLADGHDFGDNNPIVYVAFGDSITYGTGISGQYSYPTVLASMMMRSVINYGMPGAESFVGASKVHQVLRDYKPGFLLILFGVNDLIMGYGEEEAIGNLHYICQAAIDNKTIPVIATLTPVAREHRIWASGVDRLNALIRQMASDMNVALVDLDAAFNWNPELLQGDGLHPNALGYNLMAVTFYDVVN